MKIIEKECGFILQRGTTHSVILKKDDKEFKTNLTISSSGTKAYIHNLKLDKGVYEVFIELETLKMKQRACDLLNDC